MSTETEVDQFFAGGGAPAPERVNGRYRLPDPATGADRSWQTASNFGNLLIDQYGLNRWRIRQLLFGLGRRPDLLAMLAAMVEQDNGKLDEVATTALEVAGTTASANMGTAVHDALRAADASLSYPPQFEPHVQAYRRALAAYGLRVVLVERLVCNPALGSVGRLDRVYEEADGTFVLGDIKTSGNLDMAAHEISVQLAVYQSASHYQGAQGVYQDKPRAWDPMPAVRTDYAIVVHVDRETGAVSPYRLNLRIGRLGANLAEDVRGWRKMGPVLLPYVAPDPAAVNPDNGRPDPDPGPDLLDGPTVTGPPYHITSVSGTTGETLPGPPFGSDAGWPAGGANGETVIVPMDEAFPNVDAQVQADAAAAGDGPYNGKPWPDGVPEHVPLQTAAELLKPNVTKAQVQQYCRQHGITDLAHTKKVLVEMLAKAGKLAAPGSKPEPSAEPVRPVYGPLALARIAKAATVGDLELIRQSIVKQGGDQAWTDEMTEAARARVAELDDPTYGVTHIDALERVRSCQTSQELAKLWEELTVGGSMPGNWPPMIDQAARAQLEQINNSRPAAPANPFTGG